MTLAEVIKFSANLRFLVRDTKFNKMSGLGPAWALVLLAVSVAISVSSSLLSLEIVSAWHGDFAGYISVTCFPRDRRRATAL